VISSAIQRVRYLKLWLDVAGILKRVSVFRPVIEREPLPRTAMEKAGLGTAQSRCDMASMGRRRGAERPEPPRHKDEMEKRWTKNRPRSRGRLCIK
jgi:hypothetical protein